MKPYESYKDSGIEWLGQIPSHWRMIPFKKMFSFGRGLPITKSDLVESGLPVISYGQIHSKNNPGTHIEEHLIRYVPEKFSVGNETSLVKCGDLLFADTSEDLEGCGNCVYVDKDMALYAGYHTIIAKAQNVNPSKYIAYLFKTDCWRSQLRSSVNGVKVYSITQNSLGDTTILIPPLSEQQVISSYLDDKVSQIDAIIREKEKMIEDLQSYRKSIITETVTRGLNPDAPMKDSGIEWIGMIPEHWELSLGKHMFCLITDNVSDPTLPKVALENIESGTGRFIDTDSDYLGEGVEFKENDILFGKLRPYLAKVYKAEFRGQSVGDIYVFRGKDNQDADYLKYLMLSHAFISVVDGSTYGAKMPRANWDFISHMPLPNPSLSEQHIIASYIDDKVKKINNSIAELQSQIADLKSYKSSLITEAVTGKIDLRQQ